MSAALELNSDDGLKLNSDLRNLAVVLTAVSAKPGVCTSEHAFASERPDSDKFVQLHLDALGSGPLLIELLELVVCSLRLVVGPAPQQVNAAESGQVGIPPLPKQACLLLGCTVLLNHVLGMAAALGTSQPGENDTETT
ncbi:hypothetical protein AGRA3207_007387 [Actinomadura graeca]|uniref:Uncharacterized protein n=1 Tax=Actinomadura graeca TaxID=2750812 RepID=A0ABX8R4S1_9ACTN|nr:hypothetical protein [Actinomadura graeca]QXJ25828.1 hypothetical protein AGRA3207_007387 [Actinomadura graeca]